jgi:hypothetical protein
LSYPEGCFKSDAAKVLLALIKAALDKPAAADARSVSSLLQKIVSEWLKAEGFLK